MYSVLEKSFGSAGNINVTPKTTLFVDQSISLVKHIIELPQESADLSLFSDIELVIEAFVKYVSLLETDETSLRIKKTLCVMLGSMMQKRQGISFRNELKFRNNLVDAIIGLTSDFAVRLFGYKLF